MESKAIMELGEYTALIRENERLKALLRECRGKMEQELFRCIPDYEIRELSREDCLHDLSIGNDEDLVAAHAYFLSVNRIAEEWPCFSREEVVHSAAEHIRETLNDRLNALSERA